MSWPTPTFDRAIVLACTLPALRAWWLYVHCACGASRGLPIRLATEQNPGAARWILADLVVRVRRKQCRGKVLTLHLTQDHCSPLPRIGGPNPGWELLLHGEPLGLQKHRTLDPAVFNLLRLTSCFTA